jgi:hypothetical protein
MTRRYKAGPDPTVTVQQLTLERRVVAWLGASALAPRWLRGAGAIHWSGIFAPESLRSSV